MKKLTDEELEEEIHTQEQEQKSLEARARKGNWLAGLEAEHKTGYIDELRKIKAGGKK